MGKKNETGSPGSERLDRALRLIFERKGEKLKLTSAKRLRMIVPPPQALSPAGEGRGSWIELRDSGDRPIYRRVIQDPMADIEVVVEDPERPLQRLAMDDLRGAFFLIVPDIKGARRLALRSESHSGREAKRDKKRKRTGEPAAPSAHLFDLSRIDRKEH